MMLCFTKNSHENINERSLMKYFQCRKICI